MADNKNLDYLNQQKVFSSSFKDTLVLHIPHSSTFIPDYTGFVLDKESIDQEVNFLTDLATDQIFEIVGVDTVKADFSRIFCDVERLDDKNEPMFSKGAGIVYTKTDDGQELRSVNEIQKKNIIANYYDPHHQRLENLVSDKLDKFNTATIIDCHSFSSKPLNREFNQDSDRPDICLGTDGFHTPSDLVNQMKWYFEKKGFLVSINEPYEGTIVPLKFYQKDNRVKSIMIEINKKLYMNEDSFEVNQDDVAKLNSMLAELF